jgi:hypothetical protein
MELKPKHVSPRLNTLLIKRANEALEKNPSVTDVQDIIQGFRQRKSKDLYQRLRRTILERKASLFPAAKEGQEKKRAEQFVNLLFTFASCKPMQFGVYKEYARDEINELLSHYEEDLKEIV